MSPKPLAQRLAPEQKVAVIAAYAAGEKLEAVAASYGIYATYVSQLGRRAGYPRRPNKLTAEQRAALLEDYRMGATLAVLAARYGVSGAHCSKIALKAGLPYRLPRREHHGPPQSA